MWKWFTATEKKMKCHNEANTVPVPNKYPRDTDQNVINNNLISLCNHNIIEVQLTVVCFSKYQVLFRRLSLMFKNSTRKMLSSSRLPRQGSTPQRCVISTPRLHSESGRFGFQLRTVWFQSLCSLDGTRLCIFSGYPILGPAIQYFLNIYYVLRTMLASAKNT